MLLKCATNMFIWNINGVNEREQVRKLCEAIVFWHLGQWAIVLVYMTPLGKVFMSVIQMSNVYELFFLNISKYVSRWENDMEHHFLTPRSMSNCPCVYDTSQQSVYVSHTNEQCLWVNFSEHLQVCEKYAHTGRISIAMLAVDLQSCIVIIIINQCCWLC